MIVYPQFVERPYVYGQMLDGLSSTKGRHINFS